MNKIKSFKLFESEISWKSFEEFLNDVQDVFVEIMDDDILISEYGQYSFIYQDDDVYFVFKKPDDLNKISDLYQDINIAINRLKDKYKIRHIYKDSVDKIKLTITLLSVH